MKPPNLICLDHVRRRQAVQAGANGIDYVRPSPDRTALTVGLLQPWTGTAADLAGISGDPAKAGGLEKQLRIQINLTGGSAATQLKVDSVYLRNDGEGYGILHIVLTAQAASLTSYTLSLSDPSDATGQTAPHGFDLPLCTMVFQYPGRVKGDTPDCGPQSCPPTLGPPAPPIDYLAKDYSSFRQLMFDRLAQTLPKWNETNEADLGVTVVEALAYAADHVSYLQDAVATEAYLKTARRRISVRRHARLVDYRMHDGCNARAWVFVEVQAPVAVALNDWKFFTNPTKQSRKSVRPPITSALQLASPGESDRIVFEPMPGARPDASPQQLDPAQNSIQLYTWGNSECCLTLGATSAALDANPLGGPGFGTMETDKTGQQAWVWNGASLPKIGDLLLFEEVLGADTGLPEDADTTHRQVVRLTLVEAQLDQRPRLKSDGTLVWDPFPYLEVSWASEDALMFSVCISTRGFQNVSVARGNIVLVDQGLTINTTPYRLTDPREPRSPGDSLLLLTAAVVPPTSASDPCSTSNRLLGNPSPVANPRRTMVARFIPPLQTPLTQAAPFPNPAIQSESQARWLARQPSPVTEQVQTARGGAVVASASNILGPASTDLSSNARIATTSLQLMEDGTPDVPWQSRCDLLDSGPNDRNFVIEFDDSGIPWLRFGDGDCGLQPATGTKFSATYRVGSSATGNVGAEAIAAVVGTGVENVLAVRNPLPAAGGVDPETLADVRRLAPTAFRTDLIRAVAAPDYAQLAQTDNRVHQAAAALAWTGTGYEVQVAVSLFSSATEWAADPAAEQELILEEIEAMLGRYRRIGHFVQVTPPIEVALLVGLHLWIDPLADSGQVVATVRAELGSGSLPDGRLGFFHPDGLSFGQPVYASAITARAQAVQGVLAVKLCQLRRLSTPIVNKATAGVLKIGALEVVRMDDDPALPENGQLNLTSEGGR